MKHYMIIFNSGMNVAGESTNDVDLIFDYRNPVWTINAPDGRKSYINPANVAMVSVGDGPLPQAPKDADVPVS